MIIDRLVALLGYELDPGSEEQRRRYEDGINQTSASLAKLGRLAVVGATAAAGLGLAFGAMAQRVAASIDPVGKFADATGVAFEEIQRLQFATEIYGGSAETARQNIQNLQEKLGEFQRGAGDFEVLGQIGVNVTGANVNTFIDRLSDRFAGLDATRAQELGKKLGLDENFITLLRQGSDGIAALKNEADDLGIVLGRDVADNSANLIDSQTRLTAVFSALQARVVSGVIPVVVNAAESLTEFIKANRELIEVNLIAFIETTITTLRTLGAGFAFVIRQAQRFSDFVGGARNAILLLAAAYIGLRAKVILATGAAIIANASLLIVPGLIAAGVVAAVIALEDLYRFLTGGESLIGDAIEYWSTYLNKFRETNSVVDAILTPLEKVYDIITAVGEFIGTTAGKIAIGIENSPAQSAVVSNIQRDISAPRSGNLGSFYAPANNNTRNVNAPTTNNNNINVNVQQPGDIEPAVAATLSGVNQGSKAAAMNTESVITQ